MYRSMIVSALAAWFVGLVLDIHLLDSWKGITDFHLLFPLLAIGLGLLKAVKETQMQAKTQNEELPHPDAENTDIPTEGGTAL